MDMYFPRTYVQQVSCGGISSEQQVLPLSPKYNYNYTGRRWTINSGDCLLCPAVIVLVELRSGVSSGTLGARQREGGDQVAHILDGLLVSPHSV